MAPASPQTPSPPAGAYQRLEDLDPELHELLTQLEQITGEEVPKYNAQIKAKDLPALAPPDSGKS